MQIPGRKLTVRSYRWARSRLASGTLVLGYHRLRRTTEDPFDLAVSADDLASHLEVIGRCATAATLGDVIRGLTAGRMPSRSVAVTFDDGYDDTVNEVLPLLERAGVPATVFVTTGARGRPFWWDELSTVLLGPARLPSCLTLVIRGRRHEWSIDHHADSPARRMALLSLADTLRPLRSEERDDLVAQVHAWSGFPAPQPTHRSLTAGDIQRLASSPLIEIGSHTVSHPALAWLEHAEQREEIVRSRTELEEIVGKPVTAFSYPHGSYSEWTIRTVREAGFTVACCSTPDLATTRAHPLALPRFWMHQCDAGSFERRLNRWLAN